MINTCSLELALRSATKITERAKLTFCAGRMQLDQQRENTDNRSFRDDRQAQQRGAGRKRKCITSAPLASRKTIHITKATYQEYYV